MPLAPSGTPHLLTLSVRLCYVVLIYTRTITHTFAVPHGNGNARACVYTGVCAMPIALRIEFCLLPAAGFVHRFKVKLGFEEEFETMWR